jgi:hypothetical protein
MRSWSASPVSDEELFALFNLCLHDMHTQPMLSCWLNSSLEAHIWVLARSLQKLVDVSQEEGKPAHIYGRGENES